MQKKIDSYRRTIDHLDLQILRLMSKRFDMCDKIADLKQLKKIPLLQTKREEEIMHKWLRLGNQLKIDQKFIQSLYKAVLSYSRKRQKSRTLLTKSGKFDKIV